MAINKYSLKLDIFLCLFKEAAESNIYPWDHAKCTMYMGKYLFRNEK
jgi:hypothetical protein